MRKKCKTKEMSTTESMAMLSTKTKHIDNNKQKTANFRFAHYLYCRVLSFAEKKKKEG